MVGVDVGVRVRVEWLSQCVWEGGGIAWEPQGLLGAMGGSCRKDCWASWWLFCDESGEEAWCRAANGVCACVFVHVCARVCVRACV